MARSASLVVVTEDLDAAPEAWLAERHEVVRCAPDEPGFASHLTRAEALVIRTYTVVNQAMLDRAPALRVVARAGVGLDNVDLPACAARNVTVVSTPDANTRAVIEYVFAILADATRPRLFLDHALDTGAWSKARRDLVGERELCEMTLGIYGFGRIGSGVARVASALDMRVLYHDLREIPQHARHGAEPVTREALLQSADILTIHVDGRPSNRDLIGQNALALLRPTVILLNTSRGFILNAPALASFMSAHPRASALIDVHEPEPFGPDYPLLGLPNVHCSPHLASGTRRAKENMSWVVRDVDRVLKGQTPEFPAHPVA